MIQDIFKAIPLGFSLAFMIGPVFFMLLQTSITKGARAAIVLDLGVIVADIIFIAIAYFGSHKFLSEIKDDPNLYYLGGIIFIIYGVSIFIKKQKKKQDAPELTFEISKKNNYLGLFVQGFLLNFINVGVLAFWLLMVISIGPSLDLDQQRIFTFFTTIILAYFVTDIGKIVLAKQLKNKLTPDNILRIKKGMGLILIVFGIVLVIKGFLPKETLDIDQMIEGF